MDVGPKFVTSTNAGGFLLLQDVNAGWTRTRILENSALVNKVQFSKDGEFVYAAAGAFFMEFLTEEFERGRWSYIGLHSSDVLTFCQHPVREEIYTASVDGTIKFYDHRMSTPYHTLRLGASIGAIGLLPEKEQIMFGDINGRLQIWSMLGGRRSLDVSLGSSGITSISVMPDESMFCLGNMEGKIHAFRQKNAEYLHDECPFLPFAESVVHCTLLTRGMSKCLIAASRDGMLVSLNPDTWIFDWLHEVSNGGLSCCEITQSGRHGVIGFDNERLSVWNLNTRTPVRNYDLCGVRCIGFYGM